MKKYNNLKQIREIYGATQEQIAEAISVNRVTVANWEAGNSVASSSNREKLSIYYGIGPEFFYDKELTEDAKELIINSANRASEIVSKSNGERNKEADFHNMFESLTFSQALQRYMFSMKLLLATADSGELDKLITASQINEKMGERLKAIIELRQKELSSDQPSLYDLIEKIESDENT